MQMADNFGNAVNPNMIQGREDYFKDRDNEEEKFAANLDKPKN
jgi:hypothetical protein